MGAALEGVMREDGKTWSPYLQDLAPKDVAAAMAFGVGVVPWTANEVSDLERLVGWGVDGVITDYPDRAPRLSAE